MSACSALQSIAYLEHMESAASNPRLQVAMDPMIVYGLNQEFLFGSILSKESAAGSCPPAAQSLGCRRRFREAQSSSDGGGPSAYRDRTGPRKGTPESSRSQRLEGPNRHGEFKPRGRPWASGDCDTRSRRHRRRCRLVDDRIVSPRGRLTQVGHSYYVSPLRPNDTFSFFRIP